MSTLFPRALSQIGAGSTLHPFITTAPLEPLPPLDAVDTLCDAHAAIDAETKSRKTNKCRGMWNPRNFRSTAS
jgi:hypothetical protein